VQRVLQRIADERHTTPATVAYAWLVRHPSHPLPVVGSRRVEAMGEAVAALSMPMDAQTWTEILTAAVGADVP
jgi:predicted oxidoreductase